MQIFITLYYLRHKKYVCVPCKIPYHPLTFQFVIGLSNRCVRTAVEILERLYLKSYWNTHRSKTHWIRWVHRGKKEKLWQWPWKLTMGKVKLIKYQQKDSWPSSGWKMAKWGVLLSLPSISSHQHWSRDVTTRNWTGVVHE